MRVLLLVAVMLVPVQVLRHPSATNQYPLSMVQGMIASRISCASAADEHYYWHRQCYFNKLFLSNEIEARALKPSF